MWCCCRVPGLPPLDPFATMNICRAPHGALHRTYSISLFADDPRRPGATLAGRATRTPRRSSAVGSGCTRAYPVNQRGCSRRGPCAEPPLWDAPRPGSPYAGTRWLFLATLFCETWLTPPAAFVGRVSAHQTSVRSVHGTRHEHTYSGTQLHLGHDCCTLSIVRVLAVALWASPPVGAPGGGVMDAAPGSPGGRALRLAAFACSHLATAGPEHHRSLSTRARGRISGGSVPVPWQAPATPHTATRSI